MSAQPIVTLAACTVLSACATEMGVAIEDFRPAQGPAGVETELSMQRRLVPGNRLSGELLAAGADGLLLLLDKPLATADGPRRLVQAPFFTIRSIRLSQVGSFRVRSEGAALDAKRIERLKLLSRFPQGLSEPLLAELMRAYGETAVYVPHATDE